MFVYIVIQGWRVGSNFISPHRGLHRNVGRTLQVGAVVVVVGLKEQGVIPKQILRRH